ncbi:MAG TPA: molecular chaperone HtpG, partial [archaeon]|nr:molecular chaperone HtpG [archaeon]
MARKMKFKTEMKQLMDIIVNSLYSHKEIFLRELISNACDAIDAVRYESLTRPELLEDDSEWKIRIVPDEESGTLTVSDNGIGMSRQEIIGDLGTIARSGTREFLEKLKESDSKDLPELIGQFGVGFYSTFMVADKVTVISRPAGDKMQGVRWESGGQGEFTVEEVEKASRGTDIILSLREEEKEFLKEWRIRETVKKFSDFIEHPVYLKLEKKDEKGDKKVGEEILNRRKAIWLRPQSEVSDEEYKEFYKHITRDFEDPAKVIHYAAEGTLEFRAILFLPAHLPFGFLMHPFKRGLQLYVRRVFITEDFEKLLPVYLRFVKGVVDSSDLPLNVSREMLQENVLVEKIRKSLVNKILNTLAEMKTGEAEKYISFFREFGSILKEGASSDWSNREKIADLLL